MTDEANRLRRDTIAIWQAGVAAVDSERLVRDCVQVRGDCLDIAGHRFRLPPVGRIVVVGAGKAGAGMAAGIEATLASTSAFDRLTGWINVPADCLRPLSRIRLHAARPAGVNEPTQAGVEGSEQVLRIVSQLADDDVCIVLLSGGGSALLPAPRAGISLADKQAVTRFLMAHGATIDELNCIRKHLSRIKGGRLAQAAGVHPLISLIISDVIGDPLEVIASGPTVPDPTTAVDALRVLKRFAADATVIPESVWSLLRRDAATQAPISTPSIINVVIGSNAKALGAAAEEASALGYRVRSLGSANRGIAREVGRELAETCRALRDSPNEGIGPICLLSGGEPTVHLAETPMARKGGRNQELVLAAVAALWTDGLERIAILSGGTDGEDGPTDAAGAVADMELLHQARSLGLSPAEFLAINNSYPFFERAGGLLKTGPTHTNVMDLRVAVIDRP